MIRQYFCEEDVLRILQIPISIQANRDKVYCCKTKSGVFSVNSAYITTQQLEEEGHLELRVGEALAMSINQASSGKGCGI